MTRLTDADKLIETICHDCQYRCHEYCRAVKHIINAPTIDAVPVVHGHWVKNDNGCWSCSHCDEVISMRRYMENDLRYCSWCGAKMDEKCEQKRTVFERF